jgi:hypothetical protein
MKNFEDQINEEILLQVIERLTSILNQENSFLEKMDLSVTEKYLEEKFALILYMSQAKKLLENNPEIKDKLSADKLINIKEKYLLMEEILAKNFSLLGYGKTAHRKVIDIFMKANTKSNPTVTYNKARKKKEEIVALNCLQQI